MPLSVEVKEVAFVPNPVPDLAVKASLVPQREEEFDLCSRLHSLLPPTLKVETTQCHVPSNSTCILRRRYHQDWWGELHAVSCAETSAEMKYVYISAAC